VKILPARWMMLAVGCILILSGRGILKMLGIL
jgi:hypothetical protein